jgi:hypothetical protein
MTENEYCATETAPITPSITPFCVVVLRSRNRRA